VTVTGVDDVASLAVGHSFACAVRGDGTVWCWGMNLDGQLGARLPDRSVPVAVPVVGVGDAVAVSAAPGRTCVLRAGGTVSCWGDNDYGQLGDGAPGTSSSVPVSPSGLGPAIAVSTGDYHTCAVLVDGNVACWGQNIEGTLGDGTTTDSLVPVVVRNW
jgi:alpha-tubulin suppressor-like RCC1 family protein